MTARDDVDASHRCRHVVNRVIRSLPCDDMTPDMHQTNVLKGILSA